MTGVPAMRQGKKAVPEVDKPSAKQRGPASELQGLAMLWLALAALVTGGCLGAGTDEGQTNGVGPTRAESRDDAPVPGETTAVWSGRMVVSGAAELPAHFPETAPLFEPVWEGMRTFEVTEVPVLLEVAMDWTGAPGTQVQLMAEAPEREGEIHFWVAPGLNEFSTDGRLCARVPSGALATGPWKVMPHTLVGADLSFTVTVRMLGGAGAYTDGHEHWMSFQEYLARKADGSMQGHAADACAV